MMDTRLRSEWLIWSGLLACPVVWLSTRSLPVPLYGDWLGLATHIIAITPLAWLIKIRWPFDANRLVLCAVACLCTIAGYSFLEIFSPSLLASQQNLATRCVLRIVSAWLLAYLWCIALPAKSTSVQLHAPMGTWITAVTLAIFLPALDTYQRIERYVADASVAKQGNRLDRLAQNLQGLLELHPQAKVDGVAATSMFLSTVDQIQRTEQWLGSDPIRVADEAQTLDRCSALLTLGRTEEASRLLQSIQHPSPTATTLSILTAKQSENWDSMASRCRAALNQPLDESLREYRRTWIELMGEAMGRLGDRKEAAEWFQKGMDEYPSDRTLFQLKLAIELGELGQLGPAVSILESVAKENPEFESQIAPHLRRFKNHHCIPRY